MKQLYQFLQAQVVCRQLGYSDVEEFFDETTFGDVIDSNFSLAEVECYGNETELESCFYAGNFFDRL